MEQIVRLGQDWGAAVLIVAGAGRAFAGSLPRLGRWRQECAKHQDQGNERMPIAKRKHTIMDSTPGAREGQPLGPIPSVPGRGTPACAARSSQHGIIENADWILTRRSFGCLLHASHPFIGQILKAIIDGPTRGGLN